MGGAVIVESFALDFGAMASLPGPYAGAFLEKIGPAGLQGMLSSFDDKSAVATHRLAFCAGPGKESKVRCAPVGLIGGGGGGEGGKGYLKTGRGAAVLPG